MSDNLVLGSIIFYESIVHLEVVLVLYVDVLYSSVMWICYKHPFLEESVV